jgi:hypothetical protein
MSKLIYDTLAYSKMLKEGGVEHAEVHSTALADSISQNIYTKDEVDKVIEAALKRFDERTFQMRDEFEKRSSQMRDEFKVSLDEMRGQTHNMQLEMKAIENRIENKIVETNNKTIQWLTAGMGFVVALLAIVSAVLHFIH